MNHRRDLRSRDAWTRLARRTTKRAPSDFIIGLDNRVVFKVYIVHTAENNACSYTRAREMRVTER